MPSLPRRLELPDAAQLHDLVRLRRVRDRLDREHTQPLNVESLAHGVHMSPGQLSRAFETAYGRSPYAYVVARRSLSDASARRSSEAIRNREAPDPVALLA